MMLSFFSCAFLGHLYIFSDMSVQVLCLFLSWVLLLSCRNPLYILDTNPLWDTYMHVILSVQLSATLQIRYKRYIIYMYSLHSYVGFLLCWLYSLMYGSILIWSASPFSFGFLCFLCCMQDCIAKSQCLVFYVSSESFTVLAFLYRSLIHLYSYKVKSQ